MSNEQNPTEDESTACLRRNHDDDPQTAILRRTSTGTNNTDADADEQMEENPYSTDGVSSKVYRRPKE